MKRVIIIIAVLVTIGFCYFAIFQGSNSGNSARKSGDHTNLPASQSVAEGNNNRGIATANEPPASRIVTEPQTNKNASRPANQPNRDQLVGLAYSIARQGGVQALLANSLFNEKGVQLTAEQAAAFDKMLQKKVSEINDASEKASKIIREKSEELFSQGIVEATWSQTSLSDKPPPLPSGMERIDVSTVTLTGTEAKRVILNRVNCPEMVPHRELYFEKQNELCDLIINFFKDPTAVQASNK